MQNLGVFTHKSKIEYFFCYNTGQFFKLSSTQILGIENYVENRSNTANCLIRHFKLDYNEKQLGIY
jgi:hypothetical protein